MAHWLIKGDPDEYGAADLERERETVWDGVSNAVALKHIRAMQPGDEVFFYHSGKQKAIVAVARVTSAPRAPDGNEKLAVVDLKFERWLPNPVTLKDIKSDPAFNDYALVRMSRLSVMPTPAPLWRELLSMAGE